jgi:hypothetical protein
MTGTDGLRAWLIEAYRNDSITGRRRGVAFACLAAILIALLLYQIYFSLFHAEVNFDFFFYVGSAYRLFGDGAVTPLAYVQDVLSSEIQWYDISKAIEGSPYVQEVMTNAEAFSKQLPYYTIKPVYPALMEILHGFGFEYLQASIIISAGAYVLIILLAWLCLAHGLPSFSIGAVFVAILLALYNPLYELSRYSTPDTLNTALIVLSAYLAFRRDQWIAAALVSLFAIYIRPDSILWIGSLSVCYVLAKGLSLRAAGKAGAVCAIAVLAYFSLRLIDEPYSILLLQKIFFSPMTADSAHPDRITDYHNLAEIAARYWNATLGLFTGKFFSELYLFQTMLAVAGLPAA